MSEWQPIDKPPNIEQFLRDETYRAQDVLVFGGGRVWSGEISAGEGLGKPWIEIYACNMSMATHWILPEPPK